MLQWGMQLVAEVTDEAEMSGHTVMDAEIAKAIIAAIEENTLQVTGCRILKVRETTYYSHMIGEFCQSSYHTDALAIPFSAMYDCCRTCICSPQKSTIRLPDTLLF